MLRVASGVSGVTNLCSSLPNGDLPTGIYTATGGAFVEGQNTGNLYFCGGGTSKIIATSPSGSSAGSFGMGAMKTTSNGLVLALTSVDAHGLWLCKHATSSGCGSKSKFITLPSTFCLSLPQKSCSPFGTVLDKSLNLYYVDPHSTVLVKCTASSGYQSCAVLPGSSKLSGHFPVGLFLQGKDFYVADDTCAGDIFAGTGSSLGIIASLGDTLTSITLSNKNPAHSPHIYVGVGGGCTATPAHVLDFNDGISLPTPFTTFSAIYGLDPSLQFTSSDTGVTYKTTDSA